MAMSECLFFGRNQIQRIPRNSATRRQTFDPLAGLGVVAALSKASAIARLLLREPSIVSAADRYAQIEQLGFRNCLVGRRAIYGGQDRWKGRPFWKNRTSREWLVLEDTLNKFLSENNLRPTKSHSVYSLRHSFKDRLIAAEAPDSLIDSLMGHRTGKPKYGKGSAA
ncbi:hypothetical protein [Bradyrhizobium sp. CW1]|uniref:hypothetical protein n=1 Tax=Bradyrhizobium sp. CW1 TaxID=2782686 RepID=UPI001FFFDCB9|nr:hypothetical protein [Bradyrhizobium sp. CW1]